MSTVIINPGSGPVAGPCYLAWAKQNIRAFRRDVAAKLKRHLRDIAIRGIKKGRPNDGRYSFDLATTGAIVVIEMPGAPLAQVRYTKAPGQNIWDFPRLYVDGNSWVWKFAVDVAADALSPEAER